MTARRTLLLLALLPFGGGCALLREAPPKAAAQGERPATERAEPSKRKPSPPSLRAETLLAPLDDAPEMLLEQEIRVQMSAKALAAGAPAHIPTLRAMVMLAPGRISAVVSAMGLTVWRIEADRSGIRETRRPELDPRIRVADFIHDLQFTYWPLKSLEAAHAAVGTVVEKETGATRRRELWSGSEFALLSVATRAATRTLITVENRRAGYCLQIESVP